MTTLQGEDRDQGHGPHGRGLGRCHDLKVKTKAKALEVKAEAWTFHVKDEPKFQSQILQFSIGALWYLNCISLGKWGLNIQ